MASLFLMLKAGPEQEQHVNFAWNLARAAAEEGISVTLFALGEGIYNLAAGLGGPHGDLGPGQAEAAAASGGGLRILYCHYNAEQRGVEGRVRSGAEASATSQAGLLIARGDRFLTISA